MKPLALFACSVVFAVPLFAQHSGGGGAGSMGGPAGGFTDYTSRLGNSPTVKKPKLEPEFTFHATTELVNVDLVATDHAGKPILDLKPEDLKVYEDGKQRPIQNFSAELVSAAGNPALVRLLAASKNKPDTVFTNFGGQREAVPPNGATILLIDFLNTPITEQVSARAELLKLLGSLDVSKPIAIYALDSTLRIIQDFTTDPALLRKAVQDYASRMVAPQPGAGDSNGGLISAGKGNIRRGLFWDAELSNQQTDQRVAVTLDAFDAITRRIQGFRGRKNLVWLSSTFPLSIDPAAFGASTGPEYQSGIPRSYAAQLEHTASLLANADIAVYPVDAGALQTGDFDASQKGDENGHGLRVDSATGSVIRDQMGYTSALNKASTSIRDRQLTMRQIADQTGGRAFYNRNDIGNAVGAALDDGNHFYSLTFAPRNTLADGELHSIKISTSRKGVQLRYRKSYYALNSNQRDELQKKAEELELEQAVFAQRTLSTGLPLMARLDALHPDLINLWISGPDMTIVDDIKDQSEAQLEVTAVTFDAKNQPLTTSSVKFNAALKPDKIAAMRADGLSENVKFARKPGAVRLRLAIRDVPSGKIGTIDVPLASAASAQAQSPGKPSNP